jgi:predicted permease
MLLAFAILTLAMSAATITISIVDAVGIRSLPYESPSRLVGISTPGFRLGTTAGVSTADYFTLADQTQAFTSVAASRPTAPVYLSGHSGEAHPTRLVTPNLFDTLGVSPAAGRLFSADDGRSNGPVPAILSHETWVRGFGADRTIIGRSIEASPRAIEIVGVLPQGVWHPMELPAAAVYLPYVGTAADRANNRGRPMSVVARLRPQVRLEAARADAARVSTTALVIQPLKDQVVGPAKRWLYLALSAVVLVLVIACVNVATLMLARAATRAHEFAIRASLGESRRALGFSLMLEGSVIAVAAGVAAMLIAIFGINAATTLIPPGLVTRASEIAINGRVAIGSIAMVLASAALIGSAPAWTAGRSDLFNVMQAGSGAIVGGRRVHRTLATFLIGELTVVCVLLVATSLVVRSFVLITTADLGFERRNVVSIDYHRDATGTDAERQLASASRREQILERAMATPGVMAAAISINAPVPLASASVKYSIVIPGYGETLGDDLLETRIVTPEYFTLMGMQLISGRLLGSQDTAGSPAVMLINEVAARRFFAGRNPIGQIVQFRGPTTIVGVLRSVRFDGPEGNLRPEMYVPAAQDRSRMPMEIGTIVLRTSGPPQQVAAAVREAIRPVLGVEPDQTHVVDDLFRRLTSGRRFNASVMSVLGVISVVLGMAGVFSTMQFLVGRQVRDIGLRLALGATPGRIMRAILATAVTRVTLGTVVGLFFAWATANLFQSFVFGMTTTDPAVYGGVALLASVAGLSAALLPALRAASIDPIVALRRE